MKKQSLTIVGLAVIILTFLFERVGLDIAQGDLATTINTLVKIIGFAITYYGRYRQGDINLVGRKK